MRRKSVRRKRRRIKKRKDTGLCSQKAGWRVADWVAMTEDRQVYRLTRNELAQIIFLD